MKILFFILSLVLSTQTAFADSVTCTLSSGKKQASVTLNLENPTEISDGVQSDLVYDLSFLLLIYDDNHVEATFLSTKIEDEVGQVSEEFQRHGGKQTVIQEPLTEAPDHRKYNFVCTYQ